MTRPDGPRATPVPDHLDPRYYQLDHPGEGDVLHGGEPERAPRTLREPELKATGDPILAGDDWDNPDEM